MLRRKYQEKETANIIAFDMDVRMQKSNGGYFMNNEINRRDFMKLSVASIMTASVTLNLGILLLLQQLPRIPKMF